MYLLGEYCIHIDIQGCIQDIRILSGWIFLFKSLFRHVLLTCTSGRFLFRPSSSMHAWHMCWLDM